MNTQTLLPALERLAAMLTQWTQALVARCGVSVLWSVALAPIPMPMIDAIIKRMMRAADAALMLAEQIRTGALGARRPPVRGADAPPRRKPAPAAEARGITPMRFGWLRDMLGVSVGEFSFAIGRVLTDPEVQALMATTPRLGRALRPLCRMFGIPYFPPRPAGEAEDAVAPPAGPSPLERRPRKKRVRKSSKFRSWASMARLGVPSLDRPPGPTLDEVVKRGPPRGSNFLKPV